MSNRANPVITLSSGSVVRLVQPTLEQYKTAEVRGYVYYLE